MSRRLQMVILSSPRFLDSVTKISVPSEMNTFLNRQFFPSLRLHNPQLVIDPCDSETVAMEFSGGSISNLPPVGMHETAQLIIDTDKAKSVELVSRRSA